VADVRFQSISKTFGKVTAVDNVDLTVGEGEFIVLLGPSGCGKTTLLRLLAGFYQPDAGEIRFGDRVVSGLPAYERKIGMVFQNYALWPHMTVRANVSYGLRLRKLASSEIDRRLAEGLRKVNLVGFEGRYPGQLSGGQQQRVALARALVLNPDILLLDEPLSNLDAKLRVKMRADIKKIQSGLGVTTLYVTHDQVEAMTMGHRVAVMRKGELQQVAAPEELYHRPLNMFVGGFIGSPAMNMLEARVARHNGSGSFEIVVGESRIVLSEETLSTRPELAAYENRSIVLGIRPESLEDAALVDGDRHPRLRGEAELREALGSEMLVHFSIAARPAVTDEVRELAEDVGDDRVLGQLADGVPARATLVGRFSPDTRVREGDSIEVAVYERALHFFDPESGLAI